MESGCGIEFKGLVEMFAMSEGETMVEGERNMSLFKHQKEAIDFIISRGGSGALYHDMGVGKTRTAIEIFGELRKKEPRLKMIVIAPISLLKAAWGEDIKRFSDFKFCNIRTAPWVIEHERYPFDMTEEIFAVNYEYLISEKKFSALMKTIKNSNVPWLCVLDESSRIKNHKAQITKALLKTVDLFKHRIVMSGTPAPNSEMEYWPQIQFVAPGVLGWSMTAFRVKFFHLVNRYSGQVIPAAFTSRQQAAEIFRKCEYRITPKKREELMGIIAPYCHVAKKKDCLDLPEMIDEIRLVSMDAMQKKYYEKMRRDLVIWIRESAIAAPMALTKIGKLRQITSGFVYNAAGEAFEINEPKICNVTGDTPIALEIGNPKLKELFDIIEEAGNQPIIIWIHFHWEQIKICHELYQRFGEGSVVTLSSLTKNRDESIEAFKSGKARFLVAHPASAAHGLTFVNCSLQIFFSLDFSWEKYEQAKARIHRAGQTNKCTYVHILCDDTIDQDILEILKNKGNAQEILYRAICGKKQ